VLQSVEVCCIVVTFVTVCCSVWQCIAVYFGVLQCVAVCCSVLQCIAVCCSVLPWDIFCADYEMLCVCRSVLHICVCCSVLQERMSQCHTYEWVKSTGVFPMSQCVAVCCSVQQHVTRSNESMSHV